jgi:hypothetical protein
LDVISKRQIPPAIVGSGSLPAENLVECVDSGAALEFWDVPDCG